MSDALTQLAGCAGPWHGDSTLYEGPTPTPDLSASTLLVTPMLAGNFVRVDYTWSYNGAAEEGFLILGHETAKNAATAYWSDSLHMGGDIAMTLRGSLTDGGGLSVVGAYEAGDGSPDWGWRIVLTPPSAVEQPLRMTMFNIEPTGQEHIAVEAEYTRT